jgi:hypothetical protein
VDTCVGNVQKRMGARLRKLKQEYKGKKLEDGKSISGQGRLTVKEIDSLQNYYGMAIRRIAGNEAGCVGNFLTLDANE